MGQVSQSMPELQQSWPLPDQPQPIVILGTGGIVRAAHLPAYQKAGFPVAAVFDIQGERSRAVAQEFGIPRVFGSLAEAVGTPGAIFDVAVPPEHILGILQQLPPHSAVLIQKPMGRNLEEARLIRQVCRERQLVAALNFQLRFSALMLALRDALRRGLLGTVTDVEVRLNLRTEWEHYPFLKELERVELQIHSVHYLDAIRWLIGDPRAVHAVTLRDPRYFELNSTRSIVILNYGDEIRCGLSINHNHTFGPKFQAAMFKIEGTRGAAVGTLGVHPDSGPSDALEITTEGTDWIPITLQGRWFPDAFIGPMANLQRVATGQDPGLPASVEDAYRTMALVEACYLSNRSGGTPIPE